MDDLTKSQQTLGDAAARTAALRFECAGAIRVLSKQRPCGYSIRRRISSLVLTNGRDTLIRDLGTRFKCERCGAKGPAIYVE